MEYPKKILNKAYSLPNVIITDTINPYPTNDTSVFIVTNPVSEGFIQPYYAGLWGSYFVNSDSLNDFGIIEFSPDNGSTWIDLVNDTIYSDYIDWWTEKPVLTGNSNGWKEFQVDLTGLSPIFEFSYDDTIQYKFTFISDSIPEEMDGLMFDNFWFEDYAESIDELGFKNFASKAFPNPTSSNLNITYENTKNIPFHLFVYDNTGRLMLEKQQLAQNQISLNTDDFGAGMYYYVLRNDSEKVRTSGKFIVNH